jgi:isopentenyl diphosphate isomerase/L-lactate dehydrogenase-like FMN-dependent dehydrogenase
MRIATNIDDLRDRARRRLPRMFFDYLDSGAFGEVTLRRNRTDFEKLVLRQSVLVDVASRDLSHTVLGRKLALPLMLAPIGFCGMMAPDGEIQAARAAKACGIHLCVSTFAIASLAETAAASGLVPDFQLYMFKDRDFSERLIAKARDVGCTTLFLTVDTAVAGLRERDTRNGFRTAGRLGMRPLTDMMRHPRWCASVARRWPPQLGNASDHPRFGGRGLMAQASGLAREVDSSLQWSDLAWLRERWPGRLVAKGIMTPDDARRAVDHGMDAIVVSNHGGRQLDGAASSIAALPEIAAAVGGQIEVLLDSGIRRGSDIATALALGADACSIGRPYLYGLAAAGAPGVSRVIEILADELARTMTLLGLASIADLKERGPQLVREIRAGA